MPIYRMPFLTCQPSMEHAGYYELQEDGHLRIETHDRELAELLAECSQVFARCTAEEIGRASEAAERAGVFDDKAQRPRVLVKPDPPPRYDAVIKKGFEWLDSLAESPTPGESKRDFVASDAPSVGSKQRCSPGRGDSKELFDFGLTLARVQGGKL